MPKLSGYFNGELAQFYFAEHPIDRKRDSLSIFSLESEPRAEFAGESIISLLPSAGGEENEYRLLVENSEADAGVFKLSEHAVESPPPSLVSRYRLGCLPSHLDSKNADVHLFVSTASGTRRAEEYYKAVLKPLEAILAGTFSRGKGLGWKVYRTVSVDSVREYTEKILDEMSEKIQTVLLLSGDTGLWDMVNVVYHASFSGKKVPRIVVAMFPLGTGNAVSSTIHAEFPPLWHLLHGTPKAIPVFQAQFSPGAKILADEGCRSLGIPQENSRNIIYGAVVLSWGFHATLVADSDSTELRKHGRDRFRIAAEEGLKSMHSYQGEVSLLDASGKWKKIRRTDGKDHFYTLLTLVSNLEKTFMISPASKPFDGIMRVVHFSVMKPEDVMGVMMAAYGGGKHVEDGRVGYEEVTGMKIEVKEKEERWRRVCIDGAIVQLEEGGWVQVGMARAEAGLEVLWRAV